MHSAETLTSLKTGVNKTLVLQSCMYIIVNIWLFYCGFEGRIASKVLCFLIVHTTGDVLYGGYDVGRELDSTNLCLFYIFRIFLMELIFFAHGRKVARWVLTDGSNIGGGFRVCSYLQPCVSPADQQCIHLQLRPALLSLLCFYQREWKSCCCS